jgi:Secretion system C-terminal sorting domain
MKKRVLQLSGLTTILFCSIQVFAQHPKITIYDIQNISAARLAACSDTSDYYNDTVTVVGVVIADANLIDVPSSSVQGGFRPFVHITDTANQGRSDNFNGLEVMGAYFDASGASLPVNDVYNLYAGMIVQVTGIIGRYQGQTQMSILNNSSITVLGNQGNPSPVVIDLDDLNDNTRTNKIPTGEQYESAFIEIRDVTVSTVYNFSGNRVSFDVTDNKGNVINISDHFFVQKGSSYTTTRSSAPVKQGSFVTPVVGTKFEHIRGIVLHSENGCTGGTGRGYEINPFDTSHYRIGVTPPSITNIVRTPLVPKDSDKVMLSANIVDFDGTVKGATMHYSANMSDAFDKFTSVTMTLKSGTTDTYEAEIPTNAENTVVRYYFTATDDADQQTFEPFAASSTSNPDFRFYTVRNGGLTISDVQRVLYVNRDASPFVNQVVTVTGVVTASAKAYDLEAIYIQDPNETDWCGIKCQGNSELIKLFRGEEVTVTGTVAESFGFTVLNVTNVVRTGETKSITVTGLNPSDSAFYYGRVAEAYEGMLVGMRNPAGGKIYISNPRRSAFGEYQIATDVNASNGQSRRVQAGIQNTNNNSSLWVSIVSDTTLKDMEGTMNVAPIAAVKGMSFDTIVGILYYGFGNHIVLPRNDDDFRGSSVTLPETDYPDKLSIFSPKELIGITFYPNPTENILRFSLEDVSLRNSSARLYDVSGNLFDSFNLNDNQSFDLSHLSSGIYVIRVVDADGQLLGSTRIVKR